MTKRVIATVETANDQKSAPAADVSCSRTVTLRFPNAMPSYYGGSRSDFVRTLTPLEARALGESLLAAAAEVEAAIAAITDD